LENALGEPYEKRDLALWGHNHGRDAAELASALAITEQQAANLYRDIEAKRRATRYLHLEPVLVEPVPELDPLAGSAQWGHAKLGS
jgi:NAD+ synthase